MYKWGKKLTIRIVGKVLLLLIVTYSLNAQVLDSLLRELREPHHDTTKVKLYYEISENCAEYLMEDYCNRGLTLLNKLEDSMREKNYSFYFRWSGRLISNIAFVKNLHGDIKGAIDNYYKALTHGEEANDIANQGVIYNNLAMIFKKLGQKDKGIELMLKAIELKKKIPNNYKTLANSYSFLGEMYESLGKRDSNEFYQNKALELRLKSGDKTSIGRSYVSLGNLALLKNDLHSAGMYLTEAVEILYGTNQHRILLDAYIALGKYYRRINNIDLSLKALRAAWDLGSVEYFPEQLQRAAYEFYEIYNEQNNFQKALFYYTRYTHLRDSLNNSNLKEQAITANLQHQFEIAEARLKAEQEKELILNQKEKEMIKWVSSLLAILLLVMISLSTVIYKRWKITQKQNRIIESQRLSIEQQHQLLAQKNLAIEESINYASVIQNSFFIPRGEVNQITGKEIMLLFKPKDVVSGDFYWFKKLNNKLYFMVADSTGHGVPGAFLCLLAIKAVEGLFERVLEPDVDLILNTVDTELQRIKDKEHGAKAGVDMVVGCLNELTHKLSVTGSHNSLYLISNGKLSDYKFVNYYVGNPQKYHPKANRYELDLLKNDFLYVSTDGFPDQKGGENLKKYYLPPFRELLLRVHSLPVKEQRKSLEEELERWKGNLPQTDDICVVGLKV